MKSLKRFSYLLIVTILAGFSLGSFFFNKRLVGIVTELLNPYICVVIVILIGLIVLLKVFNYISNINWKEADGYDDD
jgi:tellurite resistance protein TehA-like permease